MKTKYIVWLRNIVVVLFIGQLGYFLIQRLYYGLAVEFSTLGICTSAGALILLQYSIRKEAERQ